MNDFFLHRNVRRFLASAALLLLVLALFSLIGGDGDDEGTSGGSYAGGEVMPSDARALAPEMDSSGGKTAPAMDEPQLESPREVVTTGSLTVKVKSPVSEAETFSAWVTSKGGYVSDLQSDTYESDEEVTETSTVTVRLKAIDEAVTHLKALPKGEVLSEAVTRRDVTLQAADLDARIDALNLSIARLQAFVEDAQTYDDLFRAETELTNRQAQLDSLTAQRKVLSDQVSLQTLTVTFTATDKAVAVADGAGGSFTDGLVNGWNSLVAFLGDMLYVLAVALTWSLIVLPLAGLAYLVIRVRSKRSRDSKEIESL